MLSTWLFSEVLAIESKSVWLLNECLTKIARDSCQLIFKKRTERAFGYIFVDNRPDTSSDKQVLRDTFGSCRRYPSIKSSAKSDETVATTRKKENIACEARSSVKFPPVVKSSQQIAKKSRPFPFDAVWSEAAYPVVQNYMQGAPRCQTLPKDFWIKELVYRVATLFYDPYFPLLFLFVEATWILNIQSGGRTRKNVLLDHTLFKSWDSPKLIIFKLYDSSR